MSNARRGNKGVVQPIHTIDIKHSEMLDRFHDIETELIPKLQQEKLQLKEEVPKLQEGQLDEFMKIKDRLAEINQEIKALSKRRKTIY